MKAALRQAVADVTALAAQIDKTLVGAGDLPDLAAAQALVRLDKVRGTLGKIADAVAGAAGPVRGPNDQQRPR